MHRNARNGIPQFNNFSGSHGGATGAKMATESAAEARPALLYGVMDLADSSFIASIN